MDKKLERFIINNYIDIRKLLKKLNIYVAPNNVMLCPFHENTNTPSAHLYADDEKGACIFCFAEHRLYTNYDLYKTFLPGVDTQVLAQELFNRLPESEKEYVNSNVDAEQVLPELPYIEYLRQFKQRKISYEELLKGINQSIPLDETLILIDSIYSLPDIDMQVNKNKYIYFKKTRNDCMYKTLSPSILTTKKDLPIFILDYLKIHGDCIIIPNKIGSLIYSLTFRNIKGEKQFLKVGNVAHFLYNLGNLPKDFKYGTPLVLVEGNIDCDALKEIYPYTVASLTANLSTNQIQLISHLTDKVIIAYDNDDAGLNGFFTVRKKLMDLGMTVKKFTHAPKLHDFGDLIDIQMKDKEEYEYLSKSYKNKINSLL